VRRGFDFPYFFSECARRATLATLFLISSVSRERGLSPSSRRRRAPPPSEATERSPRARSSRPFPRPRRAPGRDPRSPLSALRSRSRGAPFLPSPAIPRAFPMLQLERTSRSASDLQATSGNVDNQRSMLSLGSYLARRLGPANRRNRRNRRFPGFRASSLVRAPRPFPSLALSPIINRCSRASIARGFADWIGMLPMSMSAPILSGRLIKMLSSHESAPRPSSATSIESGRLISMLPIRNERTTDRERRIDHAHHWGYGGSERFSMCASTRRQVQIHTPHSFKKSDVPI
jgi:hypothetical protein